MFAVLGFVFQLGTLGQVLLKMGPQSAKVLHQVLVKATVRAPMFFFEAVDSSVLLNRFSQDMTLVDFALPISVRLLPHIYTISQLSPPASTKRLG